MSIEVHNKSSVYMPITKSFVNLRLDTQDIDNALRNPLEYVARCFGYGGSSMSSFSQEEIKRLRNFRDSILKNTDVDQDTLKTILRGAEKELVDAGIMDHLDHEEKEPDLERIQSLFQDDVGKYILR